MRKPLIVVISVGLLAGLGFYVYTALRPSAARWLIVREWFDDPQSHRDLEIKRAARCGDAPFIFPTDGLVGFIWDDSFQLGHRHQCLDIFAGTAVGVTPVIAAYDGYLTRLPDWKSSVIERVPSDPLNPGQQIWIYYTHMATKEGRSFIEAQFPPGTNEVFIKGGTQLGYQGNYSGDPNNPVGVHLHISIVRDDNGRFRNELDINNTYDPSPYFGMALNANTNRDKIPVCEK